MPVKTLKYASSAGWRGLRAASAARSSTRARRPNAATRPSRAWRRWPGRAGATSRWRPMRPHDAPPLRQPSRRSDLPAAAGRGAGSGMGRDTSIATNPKAEVYRNHETRRGHQPIARARSRFETARPCAQHGESAPPRSPAIPASAKSMEHSSYRAPVLPASRRCRLSFRRHPESTKVALLESYPLPRMAPHLAESQHVLIEHMSHSRQFKAKDIANDASCSTVEGELTVANFFVNFFL